MSKKPATTSTDPVTDYAKAVGKGKIIAGPHVRAACKRHLDDLKHGKARGLKWDLPKALRVIGFFHDVLTLAEGEHAGQPFTLQPWQQFIVGSIFGWLGPDGFRRFRHVYCEAGKGSGKTPLAAGIGLYMLCADGEQAAQVFAAATTQDQAGILFSDAALMVAASPELSKRLQPTGQRKVTNLAHLQSNSFFRPVSSERRGLDGKRVHCGLIDEVHEHSSPVVIDKLVAGTKGRDQPLIFEITNAGYDRDSICYRHHEYSIRILQGVEVNDSWFGFITCLDEGDDWRDESVWIKANPNLGISLPVKYLREQVREAIGMPAKQNIVRRLNFCEWTESDSAWITKTMWDSVLVDVIDIEQYRGRKCFAGLDLSSKNDLTALAMVFPSDDGKSFDATVRYFTPKATLASREDRDRAPYTLWCDQGHMMALPGASLDYDAIAVEFEEIASYVDFEAIAFDRWRIADFLRSLDKIGVNAVEDKQQEGVYLPAGAIRFVAHGQGYKDMTLAVDALEESIFNGTLRLANNPVTTMCAANATLTSDPAGNRKFDKHRASGRIDGVVALAMAMRMAASAAPAKSGYLTSEDIMARAGDVI